MCFYSGKTSPDWCPYIINREEIMRTFFLSLSLIILSTMFVLPCLAGTAIERAGELKIWREQCDDPDPDLRLAYIEQAIESRDVSIQRICIRSALESNNADIKNLGLRAAIASLERITFMVEMPSHLKGAYEKAGNDNKKLQEINRTSITHDYKIIQNGLTFIIEGASLSGGGSVWYPLGGRATKNEAYSGKAVIVGDKIDWSGLTELSRNKKCRLSVDLSAGGLLKGFFQCGKLSPFPVAVKLL